MAAASWSEWSQRFISVLCLVSVSSLSEYYFNICLDKGHLMGLLFLCYLYTSTTTWPVRKENVVALERAEMRMVRWMCGVKLKDRFPSKELRETRYRWHSIGIAAKQAALVWACAAKSMRISSIWLSKTKLKIRDDWVKKCLEYEVEGLRPRGRPKKTWRDVVREDCQARKLNKRVCHGSL